jgi:LysM repeat protein
MFKRSICILVVLITCSIFGQNYTKHTVVAGETITQIAQKYKVTPNDIYKLNPDSQNGIQLNSILLIPKSVEKPASTASTASKVITHEVLPKETKYGIATKYGITVEELERQNPEIATNLPIGFQLKINGNVPKNIPPKAVIPVDKETVQSQYIFEYTVKSGETFYSLTKQFNISYDKLLVLNPILSEGVKEGMVIKLPAKITFSKEEKNSSFTDLTKSISNQNRKELVLLLPFNISKIESDTLVSTAARLKKDKFLNMTLDFYSGALMAVDSAKVLGMNIDVKIFDSQETKSSSNAVAIAQQNAQNANAVIGPFYQNNVERVAEALESKNIPVISPLSKDYEKSYVNLFQATPTNEALKEAMFDFMKSKNGNIIAVIDPKKPDIKQYITENQKDTKLVGLTEKGSFAADSIKKYFVKDKINFVVMESESYYTITTTLNTMINSMKDYQVQLVVLESNDMLDNEEIPLAKLTKLKMTFPSLNKENDSEEATRFEKAYKKKNRVLPNQYAVRGFDITFDTMLRLSQEKSFEESTQSSVTEQVESKFDYAKKVMGGYVNKGIYILYYNTDLTIKQAE